MPQWRGYGASQGGSVASTTGKNGVRWRTRLFANLTTLGRLAAGPQAQSINSLLNNRFARSIFGYLVGIDPQRRLPAFAGQRLSQWFAARPKQPTGLRRVILFNDSYTEYFLPQVGRATVDSLEAPSFQVILATLGDSQRSPISLGLLDQAKRKGSRLVQALAAMLDAATPILVCEPSCASALTHDLPDLQDETVLAAQAASRVTMLDAFIEQELASGRIQLNWQSMATNDHPRHFVVHSHCHQKTLDGGRWTHKLLQRIPGAVVSDTNAGCCGMAGAFGYETEHAELSINIAQQRLLPALNRAPLTAIVVTNGFSCRHQIADLSKRRPIHIAEALSIFLHSAASRDTSVMLKGSIQ